MVIIPSLFYGLLFVGDSTMYSQGYTMSGKGLSVFLSSLCHERSQYKRRLSRIFCIPLDNSIGDVGISFIHSIIPYYSVASRSEIEVSPE